MSNVNLSFDEELNEDNEIKCPKCSYFFSSINKPYLLPCNHNLCQNCINLLKEKTNIKCSICKNIFNKKKTSFHVNFTFLNLVVKILKNKIILCKKCNKIYYFREHCVSCDQKYFTNTNEVIKEIKKICEECYHILKYDNVYRNILDDKKNKINERIKNTINLIGNKKKKEYAQIINNILLNLGNQNIENHKKELIIFLEICKKYEKLFDNINFHEINSILFNSSRNKSKLINHYNKSAVSLKISESNDNINSPLNLQKSNSIMKITIHKDINKINLKNNIKNDNKESSSDTEEDDIISNSSYIHNFPIQRLYSKNNENSPIQVIENKKHSMFLFNDLLDEFKLEKAPVNKIVIGLKSVKNLNKVDNKNDNKIIKNEENQKIKKIYNFNHNNVRYRSAGKENIDENRNNNNKYLDKTFKKKQYMKIERINRNNHMALRTEINKIKSKIINEQPNNIKLLKKCNSISLNQKQENQNENIKKKNNENNEIQIINKLSKNFNRVKEITNNLNNYSKKAVDLLSSLKNQIFNNLNILSPKVISNYNLLINDISYNFHQSYKRYIINFIDISNYLTLYDTRTSLTKTKNFYESMKDYYISFNHSVSLEFDDIDLVFISGGINLEKNEPNNILLCIKWSNQKIEFIEKMPIKRAFHSTIFFEGNLYLIGGLGEKQNQLSDCDIFNLKKRKWEKIPKLNIPRQNSALCIYNNSLLFVIRGSNRKEVLDTIEYINLNDLCNGFNIIKPKDYGLSWFGCESSMAISINRNQILIFGGKDKNNKFYHHSFFYDPINNSIYRGKDIKVSANFKFYGTIYDNKVIGIDFKNSTNAKYYGIHKYDISLKKWFFE